MAADGSIDWWAVPALDSAPAFAVLLDPVRGGQIAHKRRRDQLACTRLSIVPGEFHTTAPTGHPKINRASPGVSPVSGAEAVVGSVPPGFEITPVEAADHRDYRV